jgi:hypothetical protein
VRLFTPVKPSLVQISIAASDSRRAPRSAVMVNVVLWPNMASPGVPAGTSGPPGASRKSDTSPSEASRDSIGALFPFSAISLRPKLAASPTLNNSFFPRWVAATAGVSGWPPVRSVNVTSKVSARFASAAGAAPSAAAATAIAARPYLRFILTASSLGVSPRAEPRTRILRKPCETLNAPGPASGD